MAKIYIYGLITLIVLIILYFGLKRLGLIKSGVQRRTDRKEERASRDSQIQAAKEKGEKKIIVSTINRSDYFKPQLYKNYGMSKWLTGNKSNDLAQQINDAFGMFNDVEEEIYDVFRQLEYKIQVSQISEAYSKSFKKDLAGVLIDKLSKSELQQVFIIIDQLK